MHKNLECSNLTLACTNDSTSVSIPLSSVLEFAFNDHDAFIKARSSEQLERIRRSAKYIKTKNRREKQTMILNLLTLFLLNRF